MKKILALVITLLLVVTMFASVTAFAATELPWENPGLSISSRWNGATKLAMTTASDDYPAGAKYIVDSAEMTFDSDSNLTVVAPHSYYIYVNQKLTKGVHTIDIVYSIDDNVIYVFVDKMFKGGVWHDNTYRASKTAHTFLTSVLPNAGFPISRKAYGSDFNFKDLGLYGGTATYDEASGTYTLSRNIARMRTTKNSSASIGCYQYDSGAALQTNGMYIAGYDDADKLLFVETTNYFVGSGDNQWGTAADITSAVTEEADSIKLFIYDAIHHNSNAIVPAIEALEYKLIQ